MQINLESGDKHSIQGYTEKEVRINNESYVENLIVSAQELIVPWAVKTITDLTTTDLEPLLINKPKIVIIGHNQLGKLPSFEILQMLAQHGAGLEAMSIGAACRTFNVLLSEQRDVVLGLIF